MSQGTALLCKDLENPRNSSRTRTDEQVDSVSQQGLHRNCCSIYAGVEQSDHGADESWEIVQAPSSRPLTTESRTTGADTEPVHATLSPNIQSPSPLSPLLIWHFDFIDNAGEGNMEAMEAMLSSGADIEQDRNGMTPLVFSILKRQVETTRWLLEHKADVEHKAKGLTPLVHAVKTPHDGLYTGQLLVEYGADISTTSGPELMNALHWAAAVDDVDYVDFLVSKGADLNSSCFNKKTPLILAAERGHVVVVKVLLAHGADVERKGLNGGNVLTCAAYNGHLEIVKYLSREVADIDEADNIGCTALSHACQMGHIDIVKFLVDQGANVNWLSRKLKDSTPALAAAIAGHTDLLRALIWSGADLNIRNRVGDTILEAAIANHQLGVVELLLESLGGPEYPKDSVALRIAVAKSDEAVISLMTSIALMHPHVTHITTSGERLTWIEWTLDFGGNLVKPKALQNMLSAAICEENMEWVKELLSLGCDPNTYPRDQQSLLASAIGRRNLKLVDMLLRAGADPSKPVSSEPNERHTPLHLAILSIEDDDDHDTSVVDLLVNSGRCKIFSGTRLFDTPFYLSMSINFYMDGDGVSKPLALTLLEKISDVNSARCDDGSTLMHAAVKHRRRDMAKIILQKGADINAKDHRGQTPFMLDCYGRRSYMLSFLVNHGADPFAKNGDGLTGLHVAAMRGHIDVMRRILRFGPGIEIEDNDGHTPLIAAIVAGTSDAALWLMKHGADTKGTTTKMKRTPLHYAAISHRQDVVERLLKNGDIDVDARDYKGNTPLTLACRRGSPAMISTLLAYGADPETTNDFDFRPLHVALEMRNETVSLFLINLGVNLTARSNSSRTPLYFAAQFMNLRAAELLLERGVAPEPTDSGLFTLIFANKNNDPRITRLLEKHDRYANVLHNNGWLELHHVVLRETCAMVELSLDTGAEPVERTIYKTEDDRDLEGWLKEHGMWV